MKRKAGFQWRSTVLVLACVLSITSFSGCSGVDLPAFNDNYVNLTKQSYAAADMLLQQSKNVITSETPLHIGVLTNIKRPSETNALGQVIASQIGARFVQLGYNVTTSPALDPMAINTPAASGYAGQGMSAGGAMDKATITGHYAVARKEVLVNLRIIEDSTGKVMAAYDYNLPHNSDIKELMETEHEKTDAVFGF